MLVKKLVLIMSVITQQKAKGFNFTSKWPHSLTYTSKPIASILYTSYHGNKQLGFRIICSKNVSTMTSGEGIEAYLKLFDLLCFILFFFI